MVSPDTLNLGAFKLTLQFLQNRGVSKKTLFHLIDEMSQIWEKESDVKYDGALFPTLVLSRPNTTLIPSSIATGMCLILFVLLLVLF